MSDIPSDCFPEILSRLPGESILRFRCVCKIWRDIIDGPNFINLLLNRQDGQILMKSDTQLYSMPLDSLCYYKTGKKKVCAASVDIWIRGGCRMRSYSQLYYSCNGLILFPCYVENRTNWVLWNPFTREFHELPAVDNSYMSVGNASYGLGYDNNADDYKVVRINEPGLNSNLLTSETLVYSLKQNCWRKIMDFPGRVDRLRNNRGNGYFFKGALHWTSLAPGKIQIIGLDLVTERYRVSSISIRDPHLKVDIYLGVLGGCLFLSRSRVNQWDGWIWNDDHNADNSWAKLFSFDNLPAMPGFINHRPIAYLKSKGLVLIQRGDKELFLFDVEKKTARKVTIRGAPFEFSLHVCPVSLVRLNTNGGGERVAARSTLKRKRKTNYNIHRLNFSLTTSDASDATVIWDSFSRMKE